MLILLVDTSVGIATTDLFFWPLATNGLGLFSLVGNSKLGGLESDGPPSMITGVAGVSLAEDLAIRLL